MTAAGETEGGRTLLRRIATYLPGSLVPAAITLATTMVFTRIFNADEFGQYSLALAVATLAKTGVTLWLTMAIGKYVPAAQDATRTVTVKEAIVLGSAAVVALEALVGAAIILAAQRVFDVQTQPFIVPAVAFVVITSVFDVVAAVISAEQRAKPYVAFQLASSVGTFLLRLLLVSSLFQMSIELMFWSVVICNALLLPLLWWRAGIPFPWRLRIRKRSDPPVLLVGTFVRFGLPMTLWVVATMLLDVGDRFVIDYFLGPSAVGIYDANYRLIVGFVALMIVPITITLHPYLMSIPTGDSKHIGQVIGTSVDSLLLLGTLMVGLTFVFHQQLALILGPEFREGSLLMPVVLAGVFIFNVGTFVHKPFEIIGRLRTMVLWGYVAAAVNLAANFALVPLFGYMGAGYATVIAYAVYTVTIGRLGRTIYSWHVDLRFVAPRAIMIMTVVAVAAALNLGSLVERLGFVLAALLSAGLCAWVMRDMIRRASSVTATRPSV
jgi:O-antigen/teichoic acid export membrane protein